jgi:FeS assembly SUF system protein
MGGAEKQHVADLTEQVIESLRHVYDPEIPVNVYDLGLIYRIDLKKNEEEKYDLDIDMTLTTANCPMADMIPGMVYDRVCMDVPSLGVINVNMVWDPPWDKEKMSEDARLALDMF